MVSHRPWQKGLAEEWRIQERLIGSKQLKITMACNERATTEESVGEVEAAKSCLSEDIIMRVAKVSKKLEILFDFTPRDVEFAVKGGQIYLLQVTFKVGLTST